MSLWSRLRNTFSPGRQTAEIDEELDTFYAFVTRQEVC